MSSIHLCGCRTEPLLSYLAGLGAVRLVAEQVDPETSARWDGDHLVIKSGSLDEASLIEFFAEDYRPTPVVAPWNSGGGFHDEGKLTSPSAQRIVSKVLDGDQPRLGPYRQAIVAARRARQEARRHGLIENNKIVGQSKPQFIELCRATFPEAAVAWIDASAVLLDDDIAYPLILGTGGNIGRMDLSVNFLDQLETLGLLDGPSSQTSKTRKKLKAVPSLLRHALFRDGDTSLVKASTSQFDPGGVGGPNSSSTGDGAAVANPWSFVLAIEGAMVFASAAARRLGTDGQTGNRKASMPFTVAATAVGYGSASQGETSKGELWAPLWRDELSYREIRHLISEGRSQWGRNQASSGLDFVRAAATLGIDRSVDEFVRYLISVRHGQSPLAVPVGRFKVSDRVRPEADLLRQLDGWVGRARSDKAPAAVKAALVSLDRAQFAVSTLGGASRLQTVLATLANAEQAAARSPGYRKDRRLDPVTGLSAREWVPVLNDDSAEFRVAVGLASLSDRVSPRRRSTAEAVGGSLATLLRPVLRTRSGLTWSPSGSRIPNSGHRALFDVLNGAVAARAALAGSAQSGDSDEDNIAGVPFAFDYGFSVDLADIGRLLCGQLNEERLGAILSGLLLLEWKGTFSVVADCLTVPNDPVARWHAASQPAYVVLAPFFAGRLPVAPTDAEPNPSRSIAVRPRPEWIGAICSGTAHVAARSAVPLLRGRGWKLIANSFEQTSVEPVRLAAALLLHLDRADGDQRQIRFLLTQQCTVDTRKSASRERQEATP